MEIHETHSYDAYILCFKIDGIVWKSLMTYHPRYELVLL